MENQTAHKENTPKLTLLCNCYRPRLIELGQSDHSCLWREGREAHGDFSSFLFDGFLKAAISQGSLEGKKKIKRLLIVFYFRRKGIVPKLSLTRM